MKRTKRFLALLMAVLMTVAVVPVAAFAEGNTPEVSVPSLKGNFIPGEIIVGFGRAVTPQEVEVALSEIEYVYYEDLNIEIAEYAIEKDGKLNDFCLSILNRTFLVFLKDNTKEGVIEALENLVYNESISYAEPNVIFRPADIEGAYVVPDGYTVAEALEALRIAALISPITTDEQRDKYDVNSDKCVTVLDALAILRKAAGLTGIA